MVPSSDPPHDAPFASTRKCILVVEDEVLIRLMVSEELREAGYDVIEACSADEALTILNSVVRIDLVFSDVRMPGSIDGVGLLAAVTANFAGLPVIIASGHLESEIAIAGGAAQFLPKPYITETVVSAVRNALAKSS